LASQGKGDCDLYWKDAGDISAAFDLPGELHDEVCTNRSAIAGLAARQEEGSRQSEERFVHVNFEYR
jgi:hypothetical protein